MIMLLYHHEFASYEILLRLGQQNSELERKHMFAVQILMEAVVVVNPISMQSLIRRALRFLPT